MILLPFSKERGFLWLAMAIQSSFFGRLKYSLQAIAFTGLFSVGFLILNAITQDWLSKDADAFGHGKMGWLIGYLFFSIVSGLSGLEACRCLQLTFTHLPENHSEQPKTILDRLLTGYGLACSFAVVAGINYFAVWYVTVCYLELDSNEIGRAFVWEVAMMWGIALSLLTFNNIFPLVAFTVSSIRNRYRENHNRRLAEIADAKYAAELKTNEARRKLEAEEKLKKDEELRATKKAAQERRNEVKFQCLRFYKLHYPEVSSRFPQSAYDSFVSAYMADSEDPDTVERRGRELRELIESHRARLEPEPEKPKTIADLSEWYLNEEGRIKELPLDDKTKKMQLANLRARYAELSQLILEEMQP
jgi:hypothetical protein